MAYPEKEVVKQWLDALEGLPVQLKKMFGCLCVYCGGQPVGWLHGRVFSLREVGISSLPGGPPPPPAGRPHPRNPHPSGARRGGLAGAGGERNGPTPQGGKSFPVKFRPNFVKNRSGFWGRFQL